MQILQHTPMDVLKSKCNVYKDSSSSDALRDLEGFLRASKDHLVPDGDYSNVRTMLEELCLNEDDAVSRFTSYDILTACCRVYPLERALPPTCLQKIIQEINYTTPLETAAAVQTISDLIKLPGFNQVVQSCAGVLEALDREFQFLQEIDFDTARADSVYIVSIIQLVTILAPKYVLGITTFENFTNALMKVYLESIAFILKTAEFQKKAIKLNKAHITDAIMSNLHSHTQENHLIAALSCASALTLAEFEPMKSRYYELCSSPIQLVRETALEGLAQLTASADGCKTCLRIPAFLDWLLNRATESEKRCSELKLDIVRNLEGQTREKKLTLDPRIVLNLKGFLRDGAFYDSSRPDPVAATENN